MSYSSEPATPNKYLNPDGSITTRDGTVVASANAAGVVAYQQASCVADTVLNPDGTITIGLRDGGESSIPYPPRGIAVSGESKWDASINPAKVPQLDSNDDLVLPASLWIFEGTCRSTATFTEPTGLIADSPSSPGMGLQYLQTQSSCLMQGPGWNFGNAGGWSVGVNEYSTFLTAQRGIHQVKSMTMDKHAVGDCAGLYQYIWSDGGIAAQSDEGVTGISMQVREYHAYFHGTVARATGKGDIAPVLTFTGGNAWTTDGAFLLNISKGSVSGNIVTNWNPGVTLTTAAGVQSTFLRYLTVDNAVPLSTAIGIVRGSIPVPGGTANYPVMMTITVDLCQLGTDFPRFSAGDVVTVCGDNYPEQSIIHTAEEVNGDGSQTLKLKLRNPNSRAYLFRGGIQGTYISFDQNLAFSGMRSSYYAIGSLLGSDVIYYVPVAGMDRGVLLPQSYVEAATVGGGYQLFPGAEVVCNASSGYDCTLEQNGVDWAPGDVVENPHYPVFGGSAFLLYKYQATPPYTGYASGLASFTAEGPGVAYVDLVSISCNVNNTGYYTPWGGPLQPPTAISFDGCFYDMLSIDRAPSHAIIYVQNPTTDPNASVMLATLTWLTGGNLYFDPRVSAWSADSFQCGLQYYVSGQPGVTGSFTDSGGQTVSVKGGIIVGISAPNE